MKVRVLVTGATGLIGKMAVRALADAGFHVVATCRNGSVENADQVIHADILNENSTKSLLSRANASHLVHMAWHGGAAGRWTGPENQQWGAATIRLVREFAKAGGKRAVCAGSCAEYDWSHPVLHENSLLKPATAYGKAKADTGTELIKTADDLGLSLTWARIFFCYGPNEPKGRLLGDLLNGLMQGEPVDCTDGLQERDFLHTGDIGRALAVLLNSDLTGAVNLASGQATPVRDLINMAAKLLERPDLIRLGAIPRAPDDPPILVADTTRLNSIGFEPNFDLKSGIQDCINHRKNHQ